MKWRSWSCEEADDNDDDDDDEEEEEEEEKKSSRCEDLMVTKCAMFMLI